MNLIREKLAYSVAAKIASRILVALIFKRSRAHWVRDAFAGHKTFSSLPR